MAANKPWKKPVVLLLGPQLGAVSGVSAHVEILLRSQLAAEFDARAFHGGQRRAQGRRAAPLVAPGHQPVRAGCHHPCAPARHRAPEQFAQQPAPSGATLPT